MYLFFDTETSGLPKKYDAPPEDLSNWPRIVQIAWLEVDNYGNEISRGNYYIKPNGFEVSKESEKIHRISTEDANRLGYPLSDVLNVFNAVIKKSTYLVAHNIDFDDKVLKAEFSREYIKHSIDEKDKICTMTESIEFCNLPGRKGLKYPRLSELYYKLFNDNFDDAHDAVADIEATAKCFWELKRNKVIDLDNLKTPQTKKKTDSNSATDDTSSESENISLF